MHVCKRIKYEPLQCRSRYILCDILEGYLLAEEGVVPVDPVEECPEVLAAFAAQAPAPRGPLPLLLSLAGAFFVLGGGVGG